MQKIIWICQIRFIYLHCDYQLLFFCSQMDKDFASYYRRTEWKEFRLRILKRDNYICCNCKQQKSERELQVHHKQYINGKKIWEYADDDVITLCKKCHAEIYGIIPPSCDWEYVEVDDLGDLSGICEYCGNKIRFEHTIYHHSYGLLRVGCLCADSLTGNTIASERDETYKKFNAKKERFVNSPKWGHYENKKCSLYFYNRFVSPYNIEYKIKIWDNKHSFYIQVVNEELKFDSNYNNPKKRYSSLDEAKRKIFEVITNGELDNYLIKKGYLLRKSIFV